MQVELSHNDLVNLVKGTQPNYSIMEGVEARKLGHYMGGFHDKWTWDTRALGDLTEPELKDLYFLCDKSWKD